MAMGAPPFIVVLIFTSADPSSSVRSAARESTALICSTLPTALAACSAVSFVASAPHPAVATNAAAVNPTQAAVCFCFICPHP